MACVAGSGDASTHRTQLYHTCFLSFPTSLNSFCHGRPPSFILDGSWCPQYRAVRPRKQHPRPPKSWYHHPVDRSNSRLSCYTRVSPTGVPRARQLGAVFLAKLSRGGRTQTHWVHCHPQTCTRPRAAAAPQKPAEPLPYPHGLSVGTSISAAMFPTQTALPLGLGDQAHPETAQPSVANSLSIPCWKAACNFHKTIWETYKLF